MDERSRVDGETAARRGGGFTHDLWLSAEPVYEEILSHPFLEGLADGSLPLERFRHYLLQDAVYLREYARVLSLVGVRSGDEGVLAMFNEHALGTIAVERSLHEDLFERLGIARAEAEATEPSPTTFAYANFLLRTAALGDYSEALGAVLPCYWVYREVGRALGERGSPEPRYREWIETYAGARFDSLVEGVLDLADDAFRDLGAPQRVRIKRAFAVACRYEWMFWDAAWRLEGWPVG